MVNKQKEIGIKPKLTKKEVITISNVIDTMTPEQKMKMIESYLNIFNASAIIYLPDLGTAGHMQDTEGRLCVLEHAKKELVFDRLAREKKAINWLFEKENVKEFTNGKKEKPVYVG